MSIIAKKSESKTFDPLAEGAYPARIYQIVHIGTYPDYQGALKDKVLLTFEFPTELKVFKEENGEQPQVISQEYTVSFGEKANLRKVIEACDPKALKAGDDGFIEEFDIESLIGKSCLVTVIHNKSKTGDAVYANIGTCTVMPKGMSCPEQINKNKVLNYDHFDQEIFDSLPKFIQDRIKSSLEYKKMFENPSEDPFETIDQ